MTRLAHDWFAADLPDNVTVGAGGWLYSSFAFLHCKSEKPIGVSIGRNSGIYAGTFFDLGPQGQVRIGDYCTIVGAIFSTNAGVSIGDHCFVSHEVVISSTPWGTPMGSPDATDKEGDPIVLKSDSWIGARAILLAGAVIGVGSIVGAATVVDFEVPDFTIVAGNPARIVGRVTSDD
ncbi:MAG: DapH/DapD/GlmU-related protein [Acidimicrobiales bacterium]